MENAKTIIKLKQTAFHQSDSSPYMHEL